MHLSVRISKYFVFVNRNLSSSNNLNIEPPSTSHPHSERSVSSANGCHISNMKSITTEEYRKLLNCSIELYKAERTIDKLNAEIEKKNAYIQKLKDKPTQAHLSSVSKQIFEITFNCKYTTF